MSEQDDLKMIAALQQLKRLRWQLALLVISAVAMIGSVVSNLMLSDCHTALALMSVALLASVAASRMEGGPGTNKTDNGSMRCGVCGHAGSKRGGGHDFCEGCGSRLYLKACECGARLMTGVIASAAADARSKHCFNCGRPVDYAELLRRIRSAESPCAARNRCSTSQGHG